MTVSFCERHNQGVMLGRSLTSILIIRGTYNVCNGLFLMATAQTEGAKRLSRSLLKVGVAQTLVGGIAMSYFVLPKIDCLPSLDLNGQKV